MGYVKSWQVKARYGDGICRRRSEKGEILTRAISKGLNEKVTFVQKNRQEAWPGSWYCWMSNLSTEKPTRALWVVLFLGREDWGQLTNVGWWHWTFFIWKRQVFVLIWIETYSGYGFAFPFCNASANNTICAPREGLINCHDILHNIVKWANFTAKEVQW